MKRITIRDIAKATGLSITTVSLVLNGKYGRIPLKTRNLVEFTAKKLNYRPNKLAVGLKKRITSTIGLIIPDIRNIFFSEITKGVEDYAHTQGYNLILCNSNDSYKLEIELINMLSDQSIDGIIIIMSSETYGKKEEKNISLLKKLGIRTVMIDCFDKANDFSTVSINNFKSAYKAVEYLISLGHRSIGCITGPLGPKTNTDRLNGYLAALKKYNIFNEKNLVYEGNFKYKSGYIGASILVKEKPTAILCLNDMMAYGAMKFFKEQGYCIPKDISIMGFDDIFFSEIIDVPLTTITQPSYEMGKKASEILIDEISNNTLPTCIEYETNIKIRESTQAISK